MHVSTKSRASRAFTESLQAGMFRLSCVLAVATGCGGDLSSEDIRYERLGDVSAGLTGFAHDGAPIGVTADLDVVRWREDTHDWARIGPNSRLPAGASTIVEDAEGNYYGPVTETVIYGLSSGGDGWSAIAFPGSDLVVSTENASPLANARGDLVFQVRAQVGTTLFERVYLKTVGSSTWMIVNERPMDFFQATRLTEGGDVVFTGQENTGGPRVLLAGSSELKPMLDCDGIELLPYCDSTFATSPTGAVVFIPGFNSRQLYELDANADYPATASELFKMPVPSCTFVDFHALADGTVLGMANTDCGYSEYLLYVRTRGADDWTIAPSLPGAGYISVRVSAQGSAYTSSQQLSVGAGGVYRIRY